MAVFAFDDPVVVDVEEAMAGGPPRQPVERSQLRYLCRPRAPGVAGRVRSSETSARSSLARSRRRASRMQVVDRSPSPSRSTVLAITGALLLAAAALALVAGPVAIGEATTHAREHATVVAITAVIFALVGLLIRPRHSSPIVRVWRAVLVAFAFLAVVQLVEGVGGMGYGESNEGTRYSWLVSVHFVGVLATLLGYLAVLMTLVASGVWLIARRAKSLRSS